MRVGFSSSNTGLDYYPLSHPGNWGGQAQPSTATPKKSGGTSQQQSKARHAPEQQQRQQQLPQQQQQGQKLPERPTQ